LVGVIGENMSDLFVWIVSFMMSITPPGETVDLIEAQETKQEAIIRYESIANDIIEVVYDLDNKPIFDGPQGRTRTVTVILGIMSMESKFYRHIDYGIGGGSRGDNGKSWCVMQIMAGKTGRTASWNYIKDRPPYWSDPASEIRRGYTGLEMVTDRRLCISEGLRIANWSFSKCGKRTIFDKLRVYSSGSCMKGGEASAERMKVAEKLWAEIKDNQTWDDYSISLVVKNKANRYHYNYLSNEISIIDDIMVGDTGYQHLSMLEGLYSASKKVQ
jgi:hypothetical protein